MRLVAWGSCYEYEGTIPALDSLKRYVMPSGIPRAVSGEKHTTSRSPSEPMVEEQLAGVEPRSQFERAVGELGVELIHADSPPANGRVERLFQTLQDRLINEMRLAGIATLAEANRFLDASLPTYNQRVAVQPAQAADLHRPRPSGRHLDRLLCVKNEAGACAAIGQWPTTGGSIRSTIMSGPPT